VGWASYFPVRTGFSFMGWRVAAEEEAKTEYLEKSTGGREMRWKYYSLTPQVGWGGEI